MSLDLAPSTIGQGVSIELRDLPQGGTLLFHWGDWSAPQYVPVAAPSDPTVVPHVYPWSPTYTIDVDCWEGDGTFFGSGRSAVVIPFQPAATWGDPAVTWGDVEWSWGGSDLGPAPGPAPVITGVVPANGAGAGGNGVLIDGSGFTGATGVTFGDVAGTGFIVASDTVIGVTAPPGTGVVDVVVRHPVANATLADGYSYDSSRRRGVPAEVAPAGKVTGPAK